MAAVLQGKDLSSVRVPLGGDKVYKDECIYCFDTPVSMYVCYSLLLACAVSMLLYVVPIYS